MNSKNKNAVTPLERNYLLKFLQREGMNKIYKLRNAPEIILKNYENCIAYNNKTFDRAGTDEMRLTVIQSHINFITNIYPKYKKFLKMHELKSYEIGLQLGYKSSRSFHGSYKKYDHITFLVNIISMHEAKLQEMK